MSNKQTEPIGYAVIQETDYYGPTTKQSILSRHDTQDEAEDALAALDTGQQRELGHNVSGERERVVPILDEWSDYPGWDALDTLCDIDAVSEREWWQLERVERDKYPYTLCTKARVASWLDSNPTAYQRVCDIALGEQGLDIVVGGPRQYLLISIT